MAAYGIRPNRKLSLEKYGLAELPGIVTTPTELTQVPSPNALISTSHVLIADCLAKPEW